MSPRRRASASTRRDRIARALQSLSARLTQAGYTPDALRRLLGITYPDDVGLLNHAPACHRVRGDASAAATLVRLFFLEVDEPHRAVAAALSPPLCGALIAGGLLQRHDRTVRARLRIDAVGTQHFLADCRFRAARARGALGLPPGDPVYPPSSDSLMLRDALGAPDAQRILDLCTGSGIQAVQLAAGARRVAAVDVNPRAAALARLNAQLNGLAHVAVYAGDLYAPLGGEQFDLIVANPPFVASPYDRAPSYHSGGPTGDRVLRRIIAGWPRHLAAAGRAFAISYVALRAGEDMGSVAARWFARFPGRALVLVLESGTPVDLAAAQALFALARGLRAYATEVSRWVDYLRRQRIASVALVLIVAKQGTRSSVEVVEAQPRVLPIPLTPPPANRIATWLASR